MALFKESRKKLGLKESKRAPKRAPLWDELRRRAVMDGADFVQKHTDKALIFEKRDDIRSLAISSAPKDGMVIEFGVFKGAGINLFADHLSASGDKRTIYGFDSFRGLSEHWVGHRHAKGGAFDLGGALPDVRSNVRLVDGWIDDTLPPFLAKNAGPIAFMHIDTDTYTPCKTILTMTRDRLVKGSVILFDELICYPGWRHGEYKALHEVMQPDEYDWMAFANEQAALVMK